MPHDLVFGIYNFSLICTQKEKEKEKKKEKQKKIYTTLNSSRACLFLVVVG